MKMELKLSKLKPLHISYLFFIKNNDKVNVSKIARHFKMLPNSVKRGLKILEQRGFIIIKKIRNIVMCEVIV